MRFEARVFKLAKDPDVPGENQDAYRMDAPAGVAAIADGVTSSLFAGPWATILTEAVVAAPPDLANPEAFAAWLRELRQRWSNTIDVSNLAWFQKAKLRQGAFSTLLWITLQPHAADDETPVAAETTPLNPGEIYHLRGFAVGDSCLFHVRDGRLLRTFPLQHSAELDADPLVVGSVDLNRDPLLVFQTLDVGCAAGDWIILCTDAVAGWALHHYEAGTPPDWNAIWNTPEPAWQAEVLALRLAQQIRYDDSTLILLRVKPPLGATLPGVAPAAQPAAAPIAPTWQNPPPQAASVAPAAALPWDLSAPVASQPAAADAPYFVDEPTILYTPSPAANEPTAAAAPTPAAPRAVPPQLPPGPPPPPPPPPGTPLGNVNLKDLPAWKLAESIAAKSEELAEQISDEVLRGVRSLKDRVLRQYRQHFPPKKDSDKEP